MEVRVRVAVRGPAVEGSELDAEPAVDAGAGRVGGEG